MPKRFHTAIFRLRQYRWLVAAHLRTCYYKILGMQVGAGTLLPRLEVTWPQQVQLGAKCILEHDIYFKFDGPWKEGPSILIGDEVFIGAGCEFNCNTRIELGRRVLVASGCRFIDHDHETAVGRPSSGATELPRLEPISVAEGAWIGCNCVILRGVKIGRGAIIAAGSIVTKSVGDFEIWAGVPAKKLRDRPRFSPTQS